MGGAGRLEIEEERGSPLICGRSEEKRDGGKGCKQDMLSFPTVAQQPWGGGGDKPRQRESLDLEDEKREKERKRRRK